MNPPLPSDRSFGLTFAAVFALAAGWLLWTGRPGAVTGVGLAGVTLALALARPSLLHPLNRAWMRLGTLLHHVVSPLVLGAIYFLVFTPVAIGMRLAGRDALQRRFMPALRSYWIEREQPGPPPESLKNQF